MGNGQHDAGSRYVRMLFSAGTVGDLTDGQLLERFTTAHGGETAELAFTTLVERHGPMVLRVCRSVLRDQDDAHDAFQATFLVLVRRLSSLWVRESLGPWLHQVAYRVAVKARSDAARRRRHEHRAAELSGRGVHEEDRDDVGVVLHDEVNRLSWGCRAAVVLCYFDGLSPEQAARQLGCPVGTVQSRLARGRQQLRSRLTRRGLAPALVALEAANAGEAALVSPPAALVEATVQAALPQSAAAAGVASGSVIRLTEGVLNTMMLFKLRTVVASLITIAVLATGARSFMQETPTPSPPRAKATAEPPAPGNARPAGRIYTATSLGRDGTGRPIRSVVAVDPESGKVSEIFDEAPGRFRVSPDDRKLAYVWGEWSTTKERSGRRVARSQDSLWIRPLGGDDEPKRILRLGGDSGGPVPVWSPDGKEIILSVGTRDEPRQRWTFETSRINVDGSGRQPLKIPAEDSVQDWSSDGAWIVTASHRNARIGWQLYVMHPDGTDQRQVTEGGNPFYARFSPDGKQLLYSDGTAKLEDRQGIWVVDLDGKNRRRVFATGNMKASACWSPDGRRIAVVIASFDRTGDARLEIVNLDGTHRTLLTMPSAEAADMPDWR